MDVESELAKILQDEIWKEITAETGETKQSLDNKIISEIIKSKKVSENDIVYRLRKRAEIRRNIPRARPGEPDRISDICEEAAYVIESLRYVIDQYRTALPGPR